MPSNGFTFAIGVSCQVDRIGILGRLAQLGEHFTLSANRHVSRLKVILYVNAQFFRRQITHVAHARLYHEITSQYLVDRLSLSR